MCFAAVRHRLLGNFALLPSRTAMCRKNKQKWLYVQAMGIIFGAERKAAELCRVQQQFEKT